MKKNNLSRELTKFYHRLNNRIQFKNGMSLNKLALEMWGRLGCQQIDASVLSKVLAGKRLFTPPQLEIFCSILDISNTDRKFLHHCLYLDHCARFGVDLEDLSFQKANILDYFYLMLSEAEKVLYEGQCDELLVLTDIIEKQLSNILGHSFDKIKKDKAAQLLAKCLYLKGRAIGSISIPKKVLAKTLPISRQLEQFKQFSQDSLAYADTLLANAYYVLGNYAQADNSNYFYQQSIFHAKRGLELYQDFRSEKLFTIRTLVASAGYLKDRDIYQFAKKQAEKALHSVSDSSYVNALHLYGTMAKTEALLGYKNPLKTKEVAKKFLHKDLSGKGIYEVSDLRNELELYSILGIKGEDGYLKSVAKKALQVSQRNGYIRHVRSVNKYLLDLT